MDGIHDLGGKHGFGPVIVDKDEPVFHERWEASVVAMMNTAFQCGAFRNADQFRHSIERIDPVAYLSHTYYGRWLGGLETALVEAGFVNQAEISQRVKDMGGDEHDLVAARPSENPDPPSALSADTGNKREVKQPRFRVDQTVLASREVKPGHTRLPAYARGKTGIIILHHDGWVYPWSKLAHWVLLANTAGEVPPEPFSGSIQ